MQQCSAEQSRAGTTDYCRRFFPYRFAANICGVARRNELSMLSHLCARVSIYAQQQSEMAKCGLVASLLKTRQVP